MKVKDELVVNKVADDYVVVAKDPAVFNGILKLNETGAFIFKMMQDDASNESIVEKLVEEYDVTKEKAELDLKEFVKSIDSAGLIVK